MCWAVVLSLHPNNKGNQNKSSIRYSLCPPSITLESRPFPCNKGSCADLSLLFFDIPARRIMVMKPLLDVEAFEKETVTFELQLSHANVPGVWTRDGIRVKPNSTCRVSATGCVYCLTLLGLTLDDSGTVAFTADNVRSSARLTVQGMGTELRSIHIKGKIWHIPSSIQWS